MSTANTITDTTTSTDATTNADATPNASEIDELRAQVAALTARLDDLSQPTTATEPAATEPTASGTELAAHEPSAPSIDRRRWMKGAAAAAVGGAAAVVARSERAAAAGANLTLGDDHATALATRVDYTGSAGGVGFLAQSGGVFSKGDALHPAALGGYTTRANQPTGVYGYTNVPGGTANGVAGLAVGADSTGVRGRAHLGSGLRGEGQYGLDASGTVAAAVLTPTSTDLPTDSTVFHRGGELYARAASGGGATELWFCTVGGTPGTWTQIAGPSLPGQFHAISPVRAYDSRAGLPDPGTLSGGNERVVDISLGRNLTTGAPNSLAVPEGAGAISFNLAIVDTVGAGFLTVAPSFTASVEAATINWSAGGQILNNGSVTSIGNDRKVKVFAGGGTTNFIIDITGYWL